MRNKNILIQILKDLKTYGVGILIYIVYHTITVHFFNASCPLILLFGLPCPGCGLLRSLFCILTFRFATAWSVNPVSYAWMAFFIAFIISRYILGRKSKFISWFFAAVAFITIAVYIRGMILYFPNRIPYVYTPRNLTHYLLTHHS